MRAALNRAANAQHSGGGAAGTKTICTEMYRVYAEIFQAEQMISDQKLLICCDVLSMY